MATPKRLHRSRTNKLLVGVCGGLAEYFGTDPTLVRVLWLLLSFFSAGLFLVLYLVLAIIMPLEGSTATEPVDVVRENIRTFPTEAEEAGRRIADTVGGQGSRPTHANDGLRMAAIIMVVLGVIFLVINLGPFPWFTWGRVWPVVLIVIGLVTLMGGARRRA